MRPGSVEREEWRAITGEKKKREGSEKQEVQRDRKLLEGERGEERRKTRRMGG